MGVEGLWAACGAYEELPLGALLKYCKRKVPAGVAPTVAVDASIALCTLLALHKKEAATFGRHAAIAGGVLQRYAVPFLECGFSVIFVLDGQSHEHKVAFVRREQKELSERCWRELQAVLDRPAADISVNEANEIRAAVGFVF